MSSERQIEVNRQNAQQSTGPRTPDGKGRVASNAPGAMVAISRIGDSGDVSGDPDTDKPARGDDQERYA